MKVWSSKVGPQKRTKEVRKNNKEIPPSNDWSYDSQGLLKDGKQDILTRFALPSCIISWVIFIGFEIFMFCDRKFSAVPLCPHSDASYDPWYFSSIFASLGGFFMIFIVLSLKIVQVGQTKSRIPLLVALQIVLMGLISNILLAFWDWGGVCIDVLNVASPGIVWGEWFACGPLLIFITVTIVDKPTLTKVDWFLMISFFVCLVCGFLIIIPSDKRVGEFWLAMSCLTYLPLLYLPFYDRSERNTSITKTPDVVLPDTEAVVAPPASGVIIRETNNPDVEAQTFSHLHSERKMKRRYLMLWLSGDFVCFSLFLPRTLSYNYFYNIYHFYAANTSTHIPFITNSGTPVLHIELPLGVV